MLPDTFFGAVILSAANMSIVFVVLAVLAVIINLIHSVVSKLGLDGDVVPVEPSRAHDTGSVSPARFSSLPEKVDD